MARFIPTRNRIVLKEIRLTHKEYREKCDRLAVGLIESGIKKPALIGLASLFDLCVTYYVTSPAEAMLSS